MALRITNSSDDFDLIKVIEFRYRSPLKQSSRPTLFIRYQRITELDLGIKAWSDEPIRELYIPNLDDEILQSAMSGDLVPLGAFTEVQKAVGNLLNKHTDLLIEYFDENV